MGIVHIRTNDNGEQVQFRPDAAASFRRVESQAGREVSVNRTVVPYAVQEDLYERRQRGEYPYSVAHPDYSNHVYRADDDGGNAWDTEERGDWLDENGWIADIEDEPWHREYRPWLDEHINDPDPASTIATPESEEDDMKDKYCYTKRADGTILNAIYNTISGYFQAFESNDGPYNTAKAQGHDIAATFEVSASDFASIEAACAAVRAG